MGFSNKHLEKLRKMGRRLVLPSDEIKGILEGKLDFASLKNVVDFGAGTLFWSEWFASKLRRAGDLSELANNYIANNELANAKSRLNANERERERERVRTA